MFFLVSLLNISQAHLLAEINLDSPNNLPEPELSIDSDALRVEKLAKYINAKYPIQTESAENIVSIAIENASKHEIEVEMILAIIAVESTYNSNAVSSVGARGLMQVMPKVHADKLDNLGGEDALFEVDKNIYVGSQILAEYLRWYKGDMTKALSRYNGSFSDQKRTYAKKVFNIYDNLKNIDDINTENAFTLNTTIADKPYGILSLIPR